MIGTDVLVTFFLTSILLALAPGPDNIFVVTQSMTRGHKAGLSVTLGLCTGLLFHTTAVALGVAQLLHTSAFAFSILKTIGAGYLIFLAYKSFRRGHALITEDKDDHQSTRQLFVRGVIMNISNPKVSLFFLAFLPQFVDPAKGNTTLQIGILGAVFLMAGCITFALISLVSSRIGNALMKNNTVEKVLNAVAGTIFLGLALKLLTSEK